jgi:hypothetical protein
MAFAFYHFEQVPEQAVEDFCKVKISDMRLEEAYSS